MEAGEVRGYGMLQGELSIELQKRGRQVSSCGEVRVVEGVHIVHSYYFFPCRNKINKTPPSLPFYPPSEKEIFLEYCVDNGF